MPRCLAWSGIRPTVGSLHILGARSDIASLIGDLLGSVPSICLWVLPSFLLVLAFSVGECDIPNPGLPAAGV